jgi:hypothetical protein
VHTGSHRFAPLAVPSRYQVTFTCVGDRIVVRVDGLLAADQACVDTSPTHLVLDRPAARTSVVLDVRASESTRWALLVSTAATPP